jgi:regulator of protease activity HflC (stomatin/prohibitin superfamily)
MFGKKILIAAAVAAIAMSQAACGQIVDAGNVGVKIKNMGSNTGVQSEPVHTGWSMVGIGEKIIEYPVTQKVYTFDRAGTDNEEIVFQDSSGLTMSGDVAATVRIQASRAPAIYEKYRMTTEDLIHGPIKNDIRSAINVHSAKMTAEELYTGGRTQLIVSALADVQKKYAKEGVDVLGLDWVGSVRYPQSVTNAITLKTTKLQEAEAAKADEARATAQAAAKVAEAKGEAEATRIRGEALRTNPQILQQMWVEKWDGTLPTMMTNGQTMMMVSPK